jgi:6-phosphogluconate dehydrogenase
MRDPDLANLLVDPDFASELNRRQSSWRRIVTLCIASGIPAPALSTSLAYFDSYRREKLPANLTQVN